MDPEADEYKGMNPQAAVCGEKLAVCHQNTFQNTCKLRLISKRLHHHHQCRKMQLIGLVLNLQGKGGQRLSHHLKDLLVAPCDKQVLNESFKRTILMNN